MDNIVGSLLLLALFILPSTLQQQTKTVDQKIVELGGWLERWKAFSVENQAEQEVTLKEVVAAAEGVRAQLEKLLVDIAELVNVTRGQNATSQLLADLETLRGRQAVSAAVQVGQVLVFIGSGV